MEVFVLGCGGMQPLPGRHLTSILIRWEGESFLFDCGEGTQVALKRADLRWKGISAVFLSHTHADHVTGLPGMLMLSSQVDRSERLQLFGPPRLRQFVEGVRRSLEMHINYPLEVIQLEPEAGEQVLLDHPDYQVRCFPVFHSRPCLGYMFVEKPRKGKFLVEEAQQLGVPMGPLWGRLQQGNAVELADGRRVEPGQVMGPTRAGRKVVFITDSTYNPQLVPYLEKADLVICEGMYTKEMAETALEKGHMTAVEAASLAAQAVGVRSLGLIHFSPRYTNQQLKILEDEAREVFPETFLCRDRLCIELPLSADEHVID